MILDSNETITVDPHESTDLGIIDEGGVAVDRGKIVEVASSQLLERKYSARREISATGEVILPGFVDPHTHLVFPGSRETEFQLRLEGTSYLDILRKGGGIIATVNKTRQTSQSSLTAFAQARLDTATQLGTTTIEIKSGYGLETQEEIKILKAIVRLRSSNPNRIVATFLGAHAIPPYMSEEAYTRIVINDMLPAVAKARLASFCDVFCEDGAFSPEASRKILIAGQRQGLSSKIHADQFTDHGGLKVANDVRSISADHLVHSDNAEIERMGETRIVPVILPASSFSLLNGKYAEAKEMVEEGLPVALGSDFSPSNWILGQLTVAAIAARALRMKTSDIIRGITINAAKAVGVERRTGSLGTGKFADIVVLRAPTYKRIGYQYGEGMVDEVLIAGREIVRGGKRIH